MSDISNSDPFNEFHTPQTSTPQAAPVPTQAAPVPTQAAPVPTQAAPVQPAPFSNVGPSLAQPLPRLDADPTSSMQAPPAPQPRLAAPLLAEPSASAATGAGPVSAPAVAPIARPVGFTPTPPPFQPTPPPFSSIGVAAGSSTAVAATTAGVIGGQPGSHEQRNGEKKSRGWPWVMLALGTVAGSGLVAWVVANSVVDTTVQSTPAAQITQASDTGAVSILSSEPFADAAEIIAPSVVQLNLANGSLGTGVIINVDGTILTAAHVIEGATEVQVRLADGAVVSGTVVGSHEATDVAVVSFDPTGRDVVAAKLADGDSVRVGQLAVAVGSPFGFEQTVTAGIISGVDRVVNTVSMVQTDAPINPGNSGGPLINLRGEVVGINDLIFTESGTSAGVGFAISIDLAVIVADQLLAGGDVQLALLGVSSRPPTDGSSGALIEQVVPGTAAASAGLEVGDRVISVNGETTKGSSDLRAQIIDNAPGSEVVLEVVRDTETFAMTVVLGATGN